MQRYADAYDYVQKTMCLTKTSTVDERTPHPARYTGRMDERPKRRWFRFTLRTMFVVVTVLGVWLGWNLHELRQRKLTRQYIVSHGGYVFDGVSDRPWNSLPYSWAILGEKPVETVGLPLQFEPEDRRHIERLFPDAHIQTSNH